MNFYNFEHTIETLNLRPNVGQKCLFEYTGKNFPALEAEKLWLKVIDHKWYVSERLGRDAGLRVAAVDYVTNFYAPPVAENKPGIKETLQRFFRTVFESMALMSGFSGFDEKICDN